MDSGIIYAAITVAAGLIIAGMAYAIVRWLKGKAELTTTRLDNIVLEALGTPLVIAIIAVSIYVALTRYSIIPSAIGDVSTTQVINAVFILLGAWIASSFFQNFIRTYGAAIAERTDNDLNRIVPILLMIVRYVIWFVTFLLLLADFQVDITPLLAGAGIAGIALALAAQDIIGNFFGGVIIAIDKPFRIGDRIRVDTYFGDVMNIGARSTRIKTMDHQIVTVPNSKITSNVITNFSLPDPHLKVRFPFSVAYDSDIDRVTSILLEIARDAAEKTPWVLSDPEPSVYFLEFGDSALTGQLILWTNDYDKAWDVQDWVNRRILTRFREERIEIPFKQVDIRMRDAGKS